MLGPTRFILAVTSWDLAVFSLDGGVADCRRLTVDDYCVLCCVCCLLTTYTVGREAEQLVVVVAVVVVAAVAVLHTVDCHALSYYYYYLRKD